MKILWIDDEIRTSASLIDIAQGLEGCGHSVERYDKPDPALDILRSAQFDVIVIDLQLSPSDQDGIEVAKEIGAIEVRAPLVALTAYQSDYAARIPGADFAAVLNKSDYVGRGDGAEMLASRLTTIVEECETKSEGGASRMCAYRWFLQATARIRSAWHDAVSDLCAEIRLLGVNARAGEKDGVVHVHALGLPVATPMPACAPVLSV